MFFVKTISQCCCSRLVHNSANVQTSNLTSFFGSLTLSVIKISRHGDHRFCYFLTQVVFSCFFHLLQNHSRDFLRCKQTIINGYTHSIVIAFGNLIAPVADFFSYFIKPPTHETLNATDGVLRIGNGLTFSRITHFTLTILQKCYNRRGCSASFVVGNYNRLVTFHNGNTTVGGS